VVFPFLDTLFLVFNPRTKYDAPFASKVHNFLRSRQRLRPAVGAPHTDGQCLPVSELLIISTLARAEPEVEAADSEHFDTDGTL
jgi:hypothetical protein